MTHPTNMTIDAYLRQAGIKASISVRDKNFIPLKPMGVPRFDEVLETIQTNEASNPPTSSGGATISDYLNHRSPSAESALFRCSTMRSNEPAVALQHRCMPVKTVPKPVDASTSTSSEAKTPPHPPKTAKVDTETLIDHTIKTAAEKYNLPEALIKSVIQAESNFQAHAISPAGAQGLMQLMPATARELGVTDPFDIQQNIDAGARYMRQMLDRFDGDVKLALAAYNAGPGTVVRYGGNVPPYPETRNYVKRVLSGLLSSPAA